jgi:hypothetical protein
VKPFRLLDNIKVRNSDASLLICSFVLHLYRFLFLTIFMIRCLVTPQTSPRENKPELSAAEKKAIDLVQ